MSERFKRIIGLVLLVVSIAGIYSWESWGRYRVTTVQIVVPREDIPAHTLIMEDMLIYARRDVQQVIDAPIKDKNSIIGKMSKGFIAAKSPLSEYYFDDVDLIPKEGEYIFQLPKSWIKSCPSTLRRSDDAYLYPVLEKETPSIDTYSTNDNNYQYNDDIEPMAISGNTENIIDIDKLADGDIGQNVKLVNGIASDIQDVDIVNSSMAEKIKPIQCLKIAFVKNQSNQEVQSIDKHSRINGTSSVASVELIAGFEDIELLKNYRERGYQFMILYH